MSRICGGLAHGAAAAGGAAHPVHPQAAVVGGDRVGLQGAVAAQVARAHVAGRHRQVGVAHHRWLAGGPGDPGREPAAVERAGALAPHQLVEACQVGVLEDAADRGRLPAGQEEPSRAAEGREPLGVVGRLVVEGLVDHEPAARERGGRRQRAAQRAGAPLAQRRLPGGQGAGHADRHAAGDQLGGERVGLARLGVDERVARHRRGRGLAAVDGRDLAGAAVEVHQVAATADPRGVGLGHPERGGGGDGGVDRVAAPAQHAQADAGGLGVDRGHGAAGADGDGELVGRAGLAGARGSGSGEQREWEQGGGRGREQAGGAHRSSEQDEGASTVRPSPAGVNARHGCGAGALSPWGARRRSGRTRSRRCAPGRPGAGRVPR